jgi:hypothetical protein
VSTNNDTYTGRTFPHFEFGYLCHFVILFLSVLFLSLLYAFAPTSHIITVRSSRRTYKSSSPHLRIYHELTTEGVRRLEAIWKLKRRLDTDEEKQCGVEVVQLDDLGITAEAITVTKLATDSRRAQPGRCQSHS